MSRNPLPKKVLVVDDEEGVRSLLTELLSNEGYKAHSVSDGQQAIDCLNDFEPDCILLDIKMPRLNGFEALRLIRFHQPNSEVIMVTALAQVKIIEECMRFGAFGYITKPIELSHLLKEVRAALNHKNEASAVSRKTEDPSPEINQDLQEKNRKLKSLNNLLTSELFEALKLPMEMVAYIYPSMGVHSWNVAWISREIGKKLGVATKLCELAGLYHDIGKLCLPSQIMAGHWENFNPREKNLFEKFPLYGEEMIQYHEHLEGVAHVIRHQFERIDGRGYPDGLKGKHIPLHSKILAVSNFFDEVLESEKIREIPQIMAQGILYFNAIKKESGAAWDPLVVDVLDGLTQEWSRKVPFEKEIPLRDLESKMIISRNIKTSNGKLIFANGTRLTTQRIQRLRDFERWDNGPKIIHVYSSNLNKGRN